MKTSTFVTSSYSCTHHGDWEMNGHEAKRLSPDCSGKRFKASRVSRTAPFDAY